jgi:ATP-binding cassette subfamily A (ABC1) protein 3
MKLDPTWAWLSLSAQPIVYFLLYLYLDNIIPNVYGISKDCFYCLRRRRNYERVEQNDVIRASVNTPANPNADSDNIREFNHSDPIRLDSLTKKFGKFTAVDKMTVSIKGNEVFTILGHNGAGKTTAIYMLTGMLKPTSGEAVLYDNSLTDEIDEVRRSLGLCQQFDVLYSELTAYEHLLLTCRIKGITQDMET